MDQKIGSWIVRSIRGLMPSHLAALEISLDSTLEETGIDGCDADDFLEYIEDKYKIKISQSKFCDFETLTDIHDYITEQINEKGNGEDNPSICNYSKGL